MEDSVLDPAVHVHIKSCPVTHNDPCSSLSLMDYSRKCAQSHLLQLIPPNLCGLCGCVTSITHHSQREPSQPGCPSLWLSHSAPLLSHLHCKISSALCCGPHGSTVDCENIMLCITLPTVFYLHPELSDSNIQSNWVICFAACLCIAIKQSGKRNNRPVTLNLLYHFGSTGDQNLVFTFLKVNTYLHCNSNL